MVLYQLKLICLLTFIYVTISAIFTSVYGGCGYTPVSSLPSRTHLRSASIGMFDVPRTRIRQGSQAFSAAGPRAWNTLPTAIKLLTCRATFNREAP